MIFNLNKYIKNNIAFPCIFNVASSIDISKFLQLSTQLTNSKYNVSQSLVALRNRVDKNYFYSMVLAQLDALSYSLKVFPSYRFLLPEVAMDDWLAIVDPHNDYKRDHALHQPQVAFIANNLLKLKIRDPKKNVTRTLLSYAVDVFKDSDILWPYLLNLYPKISSFSSAIIDQIVEDIIKQAVATAAMFHDIGYPWECLCKTKLKLFTLDDENVYLPIVSVPNTQYISVGRLLEYPFYGYDKCLLQNATAIEKISVRNVMRLAMEQTHGYPGAIAFTLLQDKTRKSGQSYTLKSAICRFISDWVAVGIMMHDMGKQYRKDGKIINPQLKLSFDKDPLSCIVAIADVLEEYSRPSAKFVSNRKVSISYTSDCIQSSIDVKGNCVVIEYKYESIKGALAANKWRQKEIDEYFNSLDGFIDLSFLGITQYKCNIKSK